MSTDLRDMMNALRDRTGLVVLDIEVAYGVGSNLGAAREAALVRAALASTGHRVAYLYPTTHVGPFTPNRDSSWLSTCSVTHEQALALLADGAQWIGPEAFRP